MNLYEHIKDNQKNTSTRSLKEAIDMDRLRAARGRDVQQQNDKNNSVRQQIDKNAKEAIKKLNDYGYDNLIDTGNYLNDEGLLDKGLDLRDKDTLIADGWSHKLGFLRKGKQPISWFAIKGGGACGDAGIIFTRDGYTLTDDNCDGELYASVNDIPERELRYFADLADWANNSNLGGVDRFTSTLEKTVNAYMDKYPELQESCKKKGKKKAIKESAENGNLFWDKLRNNEIAEGMYVKTRGAGDAKILDVDSRSDYILVKLSNAKYQPYIAAWAPEWYEDDKKGNLTWGQGHYFSDEGSAKEYFEEKSGGRHWNINESCKGKKNRKAIKEEERPVIKLSNEYVEIPVRKGSIVAGPSIAREINSKRPNKKIVKRVDKDGKELNESIYELSPEYGGRNSYYGKAQIEVNPDGKTLYSYGTPIMTIKDGQIKMLCGEWALTNTTIRHIREFMQQEGLDPVPKAKLVKLINEQGLNESCKRPKKKAMKEANGEPEFWSHRRSGELEELWGYLKGSDNLDYIKDKLDKIYAIAKEEIVG